MFIPTTRQELDRLGWKALDVILISGDTYIDSPFTGVAVIGKLLIRQGYRVGIIAQPTMNSDIDISRLGEPILFWGITSGAVDSMVSNYTALKKRRKSDDYTPGGINNRRPDRAVIAYSNLIRRYFKQTVPIVLGGIEASLRRICHYDYWSNSIRRSILFDAKADYLIYGMGEEATLSLAKFLQQKNRSRAPFDNTYIPTCNNLISAPLPSSIPSHTTHRNQKKGEASEHSEHSESLVIPEDISQIRGLCYISKTAPDQYHQYLELPGYAEVSGKTLRNITQFKESFLTFYQNCDPLTAKGLVQKQDSRYLVHTPPALPPDTTEMDRLADLDFERDVHPHYKKEGNVKALDTIQFSISTHRGCYGECNFCAIAIHEGRTVRWRNEASILKEVERFLKHPDFKGIISDVGGPTANMYGFECQKKLKKGACSHQRCMFPDICKQLNPDHAPLCNLLQKIRSIKGIRRVFTASGIRPDLVFSDSKSGGRYLDLVTRHHVSGQMKLAPEHTEPHVLNLMGKPGTDSLLAFKKRFDAISKKENKKQFLTYYFIAAHPGCSVEDMRSTASFTGRQLQIKPEQVQVFTPTPSTLSTLMYYTGQSPESGKSLFVEKDPAQKEKQKFALTGPSKRGAQHQKSDSRSHSGASKKKTLGPTSCRNEFPAYEEKVLGKSGKQKKNSSPKRERKAGHKTANFSHVNHSLKKNRRRKKGRRK